LLERLRFVEQLDDALSARVAAKKATRRKISEEDQRIGRKEQDGARRQCPPKAQLRESGQAR
jgi:hypothetical protein